MKNVRRTQAPTQDLQVLKVSAKTGISGSQFIQSCLLRPGLTLAISTPAPKSPLQASFDIDDAPIQFGFTYAGKSRCAYSGGSLRNSAHEMHQGSNAIFHLPKTKGTIKQPPFNPACTIGITASPEFLYDYLADELGRLPDKFLRVLEGGKGTPLAWFGACHPAKNALLGQILHCPYRDGLRKLFLESKVLELLAIQINDYIKAHTCQCPAKLALCPSDVERIRHARDILVSDLENPPNIPELAALVGVNEKKLKIGFRQVFETSIFGYFREYRMQKAHEFLQQGNANVTETAYAVGYQSLSHFSHAFRERFGILPKAFLTSQRHLRHSK
ncbi:helix-turn-helix domain-containing protein [Pseudodesulfovibrio sp. F-1]|uniref:Helix-turn-helix domain-containing protein n=1 Tax=Pseudodesulfovibrio alkaliphilus TaxID=2661613 RepID=A0A7K1KL68_9BACT|nr:AraC family transcriptional regulator [Pseudodesulfovibrio alkaliphilus]MUM76790.1 helix-turn-helix domain-containing protein [Pseudodesulfovibrio alkaliphilus]